MGNDAFGPNFLSLIKRNGVVKINPLERQTK